MRPTRITWTDDNGRVSTFDCPVPAAILQKIADFAAARKHGSVTIDFKDGVPMAAKFEESVRIDSARRQGVASA